MGSNKARKGTVSIRSKNGAIELSFTYQGKKRYVGAGADTPLNRKNAELISRQIELDMLSGVLDETLRKYKPTRGSAEAKAELITPFILWERYRNSLAYKLKVTTQGYHRSFDNLFKKLGNISVEEGQSIKERLLQLTTPNQTRRALSKLSAACEWGVEQKICKSNPYRNLCKDLPKFKYQVDPKPNAFTKEEAVQIIQAFKQDSRKGISYKAYAPFVEFLLLTGCRPSEAIGLQWKNVSLDFNIVSFEGSITTAGGGGPKRVEGSKNNKKRKFPCSFRLRELLEQLPRSPYPNDLVFPAPKGGPINYDNFCKRAWKGVVENIKPGTTPYSCRDTFITLQILGGTPESVVAYWCDTSVAVIEKSYADFIRLSQYKPKELM